VYNAVINPVPDFPDLQNYSYRFEVLKNGSLAAISPLFYESSINDVYINSSLVTSTTLQPNDVISIRALYSNVLQFSHPGLVSFVSPKA